MGVTCKTFPLFTEIVQHVWHEIDDSEAHINFGSDLKFFSWPFGHASSEAYQENEIFALCECERGRSLVRTQPTIDALLCNEIVEQCTDMSKYEVCDF